jgi:hypothetical protein
MDKIYLKKTLKYKNSIKISFVHVGVFIVLQFIPACQSTAFYHSLYHTVLYSSANVLKGKDTTFCFGDFFFFGSTGGRTQGLMLEPPFLFALVIFEIGSHFRPWLA